MPIYEYRCEQCGSVKQDLRKMEDRNKDFPVCEGCNQAMVPMASQTQAPKFKGKGFYETDYGKGKRKK